MNDDKRLLRELKREIKRIGNRKRRRYLKDVSAEPDDFDFGRLRSDSMNQPRPSFVGGALKKGRALRGRRSRLTKNS